MLGGIPREVATLQEPPRAAGGRAPQWSPDGTELAFLDADDTSDVSEVWVEVVTLESGASRRLVLAGGAHLDRTDLSWSPDGRYLAYVAGGHGLQVNSVWVLRLVDGQARPVTDGRWNDHSPTWSKDSRVVFFVSNREGSRISGSKGSRTMPIPRARLER